jgi:hypothetical protein
LFFYSYYDSDILAIIAFFVGYVALTEAIVYKKIKKLEGELKEIQSKIKFDE